MRAFAYERERERERERAARNAAAAAASSAYYKQHTRDGYGVSLSLLRSHDANP